jgi:hypothetical protein
MKKQKMRFQNIQTVTRRLFYFIFHRQTEQQERTENLRHRNHQGLKALIDVSNNPSFLKALIVRNLLVVY